MADSQRLRTTPAGLRLVSEVAGELARRSDGETNVLEVTTYFPVDVDSVARVFEGIEEIEGVELVERGSLTVYEVDDGARFGSGGPNIDDEAFIDEATGLLKAVGTLKRDKEWVRKVKGQHKILRIVAESDEPIVELSYLTSRAQMPRARVLSLLNDFDAQGYAAVEVDEDVDELRYHFPKFDYPEERFDHNMRLLETVEPPARSRFSLWMFLAVFAVVLLVVVILLRF